jgi:hypothetical protein
MKKIFMLISNLLTFITLSFLDLFLIIWYGKLPKVSIYHRCVKSTYYIWNVFNDENSQVRSVLDVPKHVKDDIVQSYINELYSNNKFIANISALDIPIFDGKDIMGSESVINLLIEAKISYLNKN